LQKISKLPASKFSILVAEKVFVILMIARNYTGESLSLKIRLE
jgi:hypothetical protein